MEYMNEDFNDDLWGQMEFSCKTPMMGCKMSDNQTDIGEYFYKQSIAQFLFMQRWNIVRWLKVLKRNDWKEMDNMNRYGYGSLVINPYESLEKFIRVLKYTYGTEYSDLRGFLIVSDDNLKKRCRITYNKEFYLNFELFPSDLDFLSHATQLYGDFTSVKLSFESY